MSPITEVNTLTTPEANGSRGNGGRPPVGPPSASPTPSSVNTVTPSPKPAVDFFGNLHMETHNSGGHDPLGSSVAFSVADSVVSDSMSYNPIEEPSWLAQVLLLDPLSSNSTPPLPSPTCSWRSFLHSLLPYPLAPALSLLILSPWNATLKLSTPPASRSSYPSRAQNTTPATS